MTIMILWYICGVYSLHPPKVHAWLPEINVGSPQLSYATFAEEYSYETRIVLFRPVLDWEYEGVGVVHRGVAEFQESIHGYLEGNGVS